MLRKGGLLFVVSMNHTFQNLFAYFVVISIMTSVPLLSILLVLGKKIVLTREILSNLFSIPNKEEEYFLSSHQPISTRGLDKVIVYLRLLCQGSDDGHDIFHSTH